MISYAEAVERLYALGHELQRTPAHKFDLAHMRVFADALGNPQRQFPSVLIAGTNGKGSTGATLSSILRAAGHRTGFYTSPHLIRINERIRLNGEPIGDADFARLYERADSVARQLVALGRLPNPPSFFETMTAIAFAFFAEAETDMVVLEVGMGGRLDATNIVEPILSVITDISLDHQKYLGDTIGAIAREKAGIMRAGRPAITLPQHPEANDALGRAMIETAAVAVSAARNMPPVSPGAAELYDETTVGRTRYRMDVLGSEILVDSPLVGRHQLRNLALAITAAEELNKLGFTVTAEQVAAGIRQTRWPGRFQFVAGEGRRPDILLDVAHNPDGAWALRGALSEHIPDRLIYLVFGAMRDKAVAEIAEILFPTVQLVVATHTEQNPRCASTTEVREAGARTGAEIVEVPAVRDAIAKACELASEATGARPLVVITGSIYIVGEAMEWLGLDA